MRSVLSVEINGGLGNMNTSKAAVAANAILGKLFSIAGYVLGAFCLFLIVFGNLDDTGLIIFVLTVMLLCVWAVIKGMQIKRRIRRFKDYVALISTQQMTSLDNIAASTSQTVNFVKKDLRKMINKKFFINAVIDAATNEIIIGIRNVQNSTQAELEVFTCSGCGASGTKIKGIPGNCDYCGSVVK